MTDTPNAPLSSEETRRRGSGSRLLTGLAVGAALTYLFDPARGARRRAVLRDKLASFLRSTKRDLNARAQDVRNHAYGVAAEARARLGDDPVDDDTLAERVRAALGHRVDRVRPIQVTAESGHVILSGQAPDDEIETVVAAARQVRGVKDVEHRLEAPRPSDALGAEQR